MAAPLSFFSASANLDRIRSITVSNQSATTSAQIYLGSDASGFPAWTVSPGSNITIPCDTMVATIAFVITTGNNYDGTILVHFDSQPLSASGFQAQLAQTVVSNVGYIRVGGISIAWGTQSIATAADGSATQTVSFPASAFAAAPFSVVVTPSHNSGYGMVFGSEQSSWAATQFSLWLEGGPPNANVDVSWVAIGS